MKYLIVSDIHGSLPALEKVLAFYREQQCDLLCILGDILNYGPRNGLPEGLDPKGNGRRNRCHTRQLRLGSGPDAAGLPDPFRLYARGRQRQTSLPDPRTHL